MGPFSVLVIALFGWLVGGVVNYLADVLPLRRKLVRPFCLNCQSPVGTMVYWLWPTRCRSCGRMRSLRTWLVFVLVVGVSVWLWISREQSWYLFAVDVLVVAYFVMIAVIDMEYRLIMHPVSLAGVALGLGVGMWKHGFAATILGGLVGFGAMLAFYFLGIAFVRLLTKARGQPLYEAEGLGFGDVNLGLVVGLFLGWPGILAGLVLAILLGGAVSLLYLLLALLRRAYKPGLALPYGPFLAASAVILLYFKDLLVW